MSGTSLLASQQEDGRTLRASTPFPASPFHTAALPLPTCRKKTGAESRHGQSEPRPRWHRSERAPPSHPGPAATCRGAAEAWRGSRLGLCAYKAFLSLCCPETRSPGVTLRPRCHPEFGGTAPGAGRLGRSPRGVQLTPLPGEFAPRSGLEGRTGESDTPAGARFRWKPSPSLPQKPRSSSCLRSRRG